MLAAERKRSTQLRINNLLDEGAPFQLIITDLIMSPSPLAVHQQYYSLFQK